MLVTILTNFVKGYELVKEEAVKKRDKKNNARYFSKI